jgi:uncharacterized repeat protein (TIGR03943 family)
MSNRQSWAQVIILAGTGLYFTANLVSGNITNYIAAKFIWLSWIAAGLLLVLAAMRAVALLRGRQGTHEHDHAHHAHPHDHRRGARAWIGLGIVALPVAFGVLVPSTPLDSRAIEGAITSDLGSISAAPSQRVGTDPLDRNVLEWLRAFSLETDLTAFDGQAADVTGFVYRDPALDDATHFLLARFVMSCCVADAQAIGLTVEWSGAAALKADEWVRVRGTFALRPIDGEPVPVLVAYPGEDGVRPVERPAHPYLYP